MLQEARRGVGIQTFLVDPRSTQKPMSDSDYRAAYTLGDLRKQLQMLPDSTIVGVLPESAGEDFGELRTVFVQLVRADVVALRMAPPTASLLFDAVARDDRESVRRLVAAGTDVDTPDPRNPLFDGATPLMDAAGRGLVDMTALLLRLGANVNARSASGWTPLLHACDADQLDTARILLDWGADSALANDEGYTPRGRIPGTNESLLKLLEEPRERGNQDASPSPGAREPRRGRDR